MNAEKIMKVSKEIAQILSNNQVRYTELYGVYKEVERLLTLNYQKEDFDI